MAKRFPFTTEADWFRPETEADWQAMRKTDITATDAAALFGVSPYATPYELFHRKAGTFESVFEETERMKWGKRLQFAIAAGICEDKGWKILSADPFLYCRSRRFVGMGASPDYVIHCPARGVGLLEIKNVDRFIAREHWSDEEAPVHYEFQLQHQLECSALKWGAIGGLIGGNEARIYEREYDAEVGAEIGNRVVDFWRRVRDNDPYTPDYLKDAETIGKVYLNATPGLVLDAADEPESAGRIAELAAEYKAASAKERAAKDDKTRAGAEILDILKDRERVFGLKGATVSATTIHLPERVQNMPATSYRRLNINLGKSKSA